MTWLTCFFDRSVLMGKSHKSTPAQHTRNTVTQVTDSRLCYLCERIWWPGGWLSEWVIMLVWVQLRILKTCDRRADVADFNAHVLRLHKYFIHSYTHQLLGGCLVDYLVGLSLLANTYL